MSDRFSTSSFLSFSTSDAGVATELRGLVWVSLCGVLCCDSASGWTGATDEGLVVSRVVESPFVDTFSAKRFSRVPRSVLPASSSDSKPDILRSDSILPNRFSRPSIYFALKPNQSHDQRSI